MFMTSMAVAGFATVLVMALLIGGMYGALIPMELTVSIHNSAGTIKSMTVVLFRGTEKMKYWIINIEPNVTRSMLHQLDIGDYNLTIAVDGLANCSVTFGVQFKVLVKKHSESFAISTDTVKHVPEKPE